VGILPSGFQFLRWADLWMPLGQFDDDLTEHIHHAFAAVARLKPGVSLASHRIAAESSRGSGHHVMIDRPDVVVRGIQRVVTQTITHIANPSIGTTSAE